MTNIDDILYAPILDRIKSLSLYFPDLSDEITPALEQYLFQLNDAPIRKKIIETVDRIVAEYITHHEPLYNYRVVCDETNNGPDEIVNHELIVDIWLQPTDITDGANYRAKLGDTPVRSLYDILRP